MILLASASPRRKSLLGQLVKEFDVLPADIDETPFVNEIAADYVKRMALEKAKAASALSQQSKLSPPNRAIIIGSDTSVVLNGTILGKPESFEQAKGMLRTLSGNTHQVMTSVCLLDARFDHHLVENVITEVTFRRISDLEISQYWQTGEPQDKAGSYGIQGLGSVFVERISGSYSAVVGLPLFETAQLLQQVGITPLQEMTNE
jgi:septum formation protein